MTVTKVDADKIKNLMRRSDLSALEAMKAFISNDDSKEYEELLVDAQFDLDMRPEEYKEYKKHLLAFFNRYGINIE